MSASTSEAASTAREDSPAAAPSSSGRDGKAAPPGRPATTAAAGAPAGKRFAPGPSASPATVCSSSPPSSSASSSSPSTMPHPRRIAPALSEQQCRKFFAVVAAFGLVHCQWERVLGALRASGLFKGVSQHTLVEHGKLLLRSTFDPDLRERLPDCMVTGTSHKGQPPVQLRRRLAVLDTLWSVFVELDAKVSGELTQRFGWTDESVFWTRKHDLKAIRSSFQKGYGAEYFTDVLESDVEGLFHPLKCHLLFQNQLAALWSDDARRAAAATAAAAGVGGGCDSDKTVAEARSSISIRFLQAQLLPREADPCWLVRSYGVVADKASAVARMMPHAFLPFGIAMSSLPLSTPVLYGGNITLRVHDASRLGVIVGLGPFVTQDELNRDIAGFLAKSVVVTVAGKAVSLPAAELRDFSTGLKKGTVINFSCTLGSAPLLLINGVAMRGSEDATSAAAADADVAATPESRTPGLPAGNTSRVGVYPFVCLRSASDAVVMQHAKFPCTYRIPAVRVEQFLKSRFQCLERIAGQYMSQRATQPIESQ